MMLYGFLDKDELEVFKLLIGVSGIGPKGAGDLIKKYHTVEYIYDHIDELDIKDGVRNKLKNSKENAILSRML